MFQIPSDERAKATSRYAAAKEEENKRLERERQRGAAIKVHEARVQAAAAKEEAEYAVPVAGDTVGAAAVSGARPVLSLVGRILGICARLRRRYAAWLLGLRLPP